MDRRLIVHVVGAIVLAIHAFSSSALSYASVVGEPHAAPTTQCPCCPDDPGDMTGCLNLCGSHALAGAQLPTPIAALSHAEIGSPPTDGQSLTHAPPDPPPIR